MRRSGGQKAARRHRFVAMMEPQASRARQLPTWRPGTKRWTSGQRRKLRVIVPCLVVIGIMLGLVAYSPQLYRLFCGATGLGGTTQRVNEDTAAIAKRMVTVQFDSNVEPGLPWRFAPEQRAVQVHLGEQKLVYFSAENTSDQPIVGHATFNVTPLQTGIYFNKIQCFCFTEERLDPHQKVDMPVVFFVDPAFGEGSRSAQHRYDHARLYVLPLGQSRQRHGSVALPSRRAAGRRPRQDAVQRALHRLSRARCQQIRPDARWRGRPQGRRGRRLSLFAGAQERELDLVGRKPRSVVGRSAGIRSRRKNAGPRSGDERRAATSLPICGRKAAARSGQQPPPDRDPRSTGVDSAQALCDRRPDSQINISMSPCCPQRGDACQAF